MRRTQCLFISLAMTLLAFMLSANGCKQPPKVIPPLNTGGTTETKPPTGQPSAAKISLTASPTAIEMGKSTTLSWDSSYATSVTIDNGIGTVEASGSRTISPRASTTYKGTATGQIGNPATSEVRVTVTTPPEPGDGDINGGGGKKKSPIEEVQREIKDTFFDYDQYSIRDDARTALLANALLLKKYPEVKITIEGHCDERGSEKYNLALGDRRAISARDFLTAQGIESSRIDTISYGKERNFCEEHNEDCYQLNRRAHFSLR
jgi:peptidoglycan-associated lipoprotein